MIKVKKINKLNTEARIKEASVNELLENLSFIRDYLGYISKKIFFKETYFDKILSQTDKEIINILEKKGYEIILK